MLVGIKIKFVSSVHGSTVLLLEGFIFTLYYLSVDAPCAQVPVEAEEGIWSPGAGVTGAYETPDMSTGTELRSPGGTAGADRKVQIIQMPIKP